MHKIELNGIVLSRYLSPEYKRKLEGERNDVEKTPTWYKECIMGRACLYFLYVCSFCLCETNVKGYPSYQVLFPLIKCHPLYLSMLVRSISAFEGFIKCKHVPQLQVINNNTTEALTKNFA